MYVPDNFRIDDRAALHALIRAYPFAALISSGASGLNGTHLPTVLKDEGVHGVVECHLARANPHWKELAEGREALMIFSGPEAYVSPNWYPSKAETHKAVPTWNYAVVHAYGTPEIVKDAAWTRRHVSEISDQQERSEPRPWSLAEAPENYVEMMLRGIVGFRFVISRLEGKAKMSQNREARDRDGVVAGLDRRAEPGDAAVAALMRELAGKS